MASGKRIAVVTGSSRDYAFELIEILDRYNNSGCA
jgi:hypothetical protein